MRLLQLVLSALLPMLLGTNAGAGTIVSDRATLDALLGSSAIRVDFENFNLGSFPQQIPLNINQPLDSTTVLSAPPQGPGLVPSAVSFVPQTEPSAGAGWLAINPPPNFPTPLDSTVTLGTAGGGGGAPPTALRVDFSVPFNTFGFDLLSPGLSFLEGINTFEITVFGDDDTTVLQTHVFDVATPIFTGGREFFGIAESEPIGSVKIQAQTFLGVDDLAFGQAQPQTIPEPDTFALCGLCLATLVWFQQRHEIVGRDRKRV